MKTWNIIGRRFFITKQSESWTDNIYPKDLRVISYNSNLGLAGIVYDKEKEKLKKDIHYIPTNILFANYNSIKPDMIVSVVMVENKDSRANIEIIISRFVNDVYDRDNVLSQKCFKLKILETMYTDKDKPLPYHLGYIGDIPGIDLYPFKDKTNSHFIGPMINESRYDKYFMNTSNVLLESHVYGYYDDNVYDLLSMIDYTDKAEFRRIISYLVHYVYDDDPDKLYSMITDKGSVYHYLEKEFYTSTFNTNLLQNAYDIIADVYPVDMETDKLLETIRKGIDKKLLYELLYRNINFDLDIRPMILINFVDLDSMSEAPFITVDRSRQEARDMNLIPIVFKSKNTVSKNIYEYNQLYDNIHLFVVDQKPIDIINNDAMSKDEMDVFMNLQKC